MSQAQQDSNVKVHYTGKLADGTVFDDSRGREPLEVQLGQSLVIPGFEAAIVGMSIGESKTVTIPPEAAYGPRHDEMIQQVPKDKLPEGLELQVGLQLEARSPEGQSIPVLITEVNEADVTLDANHPLAGKELTFEIELMEVG
jgi:peptidylprolyl isomerase